MGYTYKKGNGLNPTNEKIWEPCYVSKIVRPDDGDVPFWPERFILRTYRTTKSVRGGAGGPR